MRGDDCKHNCTGIRISRPPPHQSCPVQHRMPMIACMPKEVLMIASKVASFVYGIDVEANRIESNHGSERFSDALAHLA